MSFQKDGLLLVDKASGITSHDVVDLLRRSSRIKKVGHTGTLDPLATGLLILCVGKATRLQSYLMNMSKTYEGTIQFGWSTDTYDAEGTASGEETPADIEGVAFDALLEPFRGRIEQMPPSFSAKKVQGVRAYELARQGETPQLKPKSVEIHELSILRKEGSRIEFRVRCSAGTYVRSIAHELGVAVGVGAHLASLRRTAIGGFQVEKAISSARIREMAREELFVAPQYVSMERVDLQLPTITVDPSQEGKLMRGQTVLVRPDREGIRKNDMVSVSNLQDELVAIAQAVDVLREDGGPVALQPRVVLKD